ncbi:hypothetical protein ACQEUU_00270 [Nonomuraea sp. CA-218870]|uniref:hypothetical protein n=1 Tax=Nonomuraea sp. CA-218870 TaxID=3239998 RepID=UPI003D94B229
MSGVSNGFPRPGDRLHPPGSAGKPPAVRSTRRAATSRASTGWNRSPPGTGTTGSLATRVTALSTRSWNWAARSIVQGTPESITARSASRW